MNSGNSQSASLSQLYEQLLSPGRMDAYRWFEANYEVVVQNKLSSDSDKIFLGSNEDRVCRYCRRAEPDTTFKDVSHALPEQLGNKALIDLLECDLCNKHFSRLHDDHLAKWSHPFRIAGRIRGKNGIPKYKAYDGSLTIQRGEEAELAFYIEPGQFGKSLDVEGKKLRVEVKRQPYIPRAVYKALVKMALALLPPDEREHWDGHRRWLLEPNHDLTVFAPLKVITQLIPGPVPPDCVAYQLMKRRPGVTGCAQLHLAVQFANTVMQIDLIRQELHLAQPAVASAEVQYSTAPTPTLWALEEYGAKHGQIDVRHMDLTSNELRRDDVERLHFSFEAVIPDDEQEAQA